MFVFYIIVIAFCSWVIYAGLRQYFHPHDDLKDLPLTEISGIIVSTPKAHKGSGRGDYSYIRFQLTDCPKADFYIENSGYDATSRSYLYRINAGDSVFIKIPTEDYQKKITMEKPLNFSDKTDASNIILVYDFRDLQYRYLTLDNYKAANIADSKYGPFIALLALVILTLNIRDWYKRSRKITQL